MNRRITEIDGIIRRLYEDRIAEHISGERFSILSREYEEEQRTLKEKAAALEQELNSETENAENLEKFIQTASRYTELPELTHEILRESISAIYVSENVRVDRPVQRISILYNFIGQIQIEDEIKTA